MNLSSTRHLGGTITAGSTASGSRYASHTTRAPHSFCWMRLAVFPGFPDVPSLSGTQLQCRQDLLASTRGAGAPQETSLTLQMELFDDECPQLCANFRRLCNGESATRQGTVYCHQGLTPSYCGTYFHKIIPSYCVQGGDITMRVVPGGSNSYSSAGRGWLNDESKRRRHNEMGLVSMANNGPNSNGSQFFITTSAANERSFNGRHCCIGRVVSGLDKFLSLVAPYGDKDGRPSRYVVVVDCGEGVAPADTLAMSSSQELTKKGEAIVGTPPPATATATAVSTTHLTNTANTAVSSVAHHSVTGGDDAASVQGASQQKAAETNIVGEATAATVEAAARILTPPASAVEAAASLSSPSADPPSQLPLKSSMKKKTGASNKHVSYKE
jgi:peptidylprolyl isomerase